MRVKPMKKDVLSGSAGMGGRKRFWAVAVSAGLAVASLVVVGPARADFAEMFENFRKAVEDFKVGADESNLDSAGEAQGNEGGNLNVPAFQNALTAYGANVTKLRTVVEQLGEANPDSAVAALSAKAAANQVLSAGAQDAREKQREYMKSLVTDTSGFARDAAQASADGQGLQSSQDVLKKILEQNAALAKINQASIQMGAQAAKGIDDNTVQLGTLNQSVGALIDDNRAKEQERWFKNKNLVLKSELAAKNFMTNFSQ
jgi:hypothetical protein